jgi:hypothetical protein
MQEQDAGTDFAFAGQQCTLVSEHDLHFFARLHVMTIPFCSRHPSILLFTATPVLIAL